MGYTTSFSGAINLSRALTIAEAKYLLEMNEERELTKQRLGVNAYMQWVPTTNLNAIVWDGEEKFYEYVPLLEKLCEWLASKGIASNGEIFWQGEETGDVGRIFVKDDVVVSKTTMEPMRSVYQPLDMSGLEKLALEQITSA